jgi:hypothetical protein
MRPVIVVGRVRNIATGITDAMISLENAGANRGILILPSGDEYLIQGDARAIGDQIEVTMCQEPINGIVCPESSLLILAKRSLLFTAVIDSSARIFASMASRIALTRPPSRCTA